MVHFKEDRLIIEIPTVTNPIEDWLEIQSELITLLQCADYELMGNNPPHHVLGLLRELQLDHSTGIKLLK